MSKLKIDNLLMYFLIAILSFSCQGLSDGNRDLSGEYWNKTYDCGDCRMISSRKGHKHNSIYPTVTDCVFNNEFILAEQRPSKEHYIPQFGEDLFRRFETYALYKKDTSILQDAFDSKLRGIVEKDSSLYSSFIERGASNDESNNRAIGIHLAQSLIANAPYYLKTFSSKLNYWIICHKSDTLIGPLTQKEYFDTKKALNIPNNLKLSFENP